MLEYEQYVQIRDPIGKNATPAPEPHSATQPTAPITTQTYSMTHKVTEDKDFSMSLLPSLGYIN